MDAEAKYSRMLESLSAHRGVLVAFSGGVDSALLLAAALEALGPRALAVTGRSPSIPDSEVRHAAEVAEQLGARHRVIETDELSKPEYQRNDPNRCFVCKSTLFDALLGVCRDEGLELVLEGSNADDRDDYRPGLKAARDRGVRAPLMEAGLGKDEIRRLARAREIPVWDRPSLACLSSRVPYGTPVTVERLQRIQQAEEAVRREGFEQLRVRDHGPVARIEVAPAELDRMLDVELRARVVAGVKQAGYLYVALDLQGYRTGAMNEAL
jgi:uncharacterized protein